MIGVTDGDTIRVLAAGNEQIIIRLAEIDAPERSQPWGARSRQILSETVGGREVTIEKSDEDRWGRTVARIRVNGEDVNRQMVAAGAAWAFRRYLTDQSLIAVEEGAKRQGRGLWSMPANQTVAPWEWRQGVRAASARPEATTAGARSLVSAPPALSAGTFSCGQKTRCAQMNTCAEANFYLRQCGLQTIEGDHDGEPCEALCGTAE